MATPAAVLSILVDVQSGKASVALAGVQKQLVTTNTHAEALEKQSAKTGASLSTFGGRVSKAGKSLSTLAGHAEKSSHSFRHLATGLLEVGGAFAAFEAAKNAIESTVELGHATERLSAITGLSVKEASTWIETMKVRGVQSKAVGMSFITLSRNINKAEDGSKTAKKAFQALGVPMEDLKKRNTQQVLLEVANGLEKVESPAKRAAFAQQLFGRGAQALIPILKEGKKGVEEALGATQKYGAFLPGNSQKLRDSVEAQHNLNLAMDGLKISFTTAVLPSLVEGAKKLLGFIAQMRSGKGAGGDFARAISGAFKTIRDAIKNVVTAFGGLGNTIRIAVGAFAAYKIVQFGLALKGMFDLIRANPIGLFLTAVGLLAGALLVLSNNQKSAAQTAREVRDAWNAARDAADELRDANLEVVQAKLNHIKADEALKQAQKDLTKAADDYGKKSPQYKQAEENVAQAKIDSKQASNDLSDAYKHQGQAQDKATDANKKFQEQGRSQVSDDKARIKRIQDEIAAQGGLNGAIRGGIPNTDKMRDLRRKLSAATQQLTTDQQNLNQKIIQMPGFKLSDIQVDVSFASNISNAISLIAQQVGGHFAPLQPHPAFAGHYSGGMVTEPSYMVGEEAPQHPEVILATNPAYRSRNLGLWATAGHMLGVPGFQQGGLTGADATITAGITPWISKTAGSWMKQQAASWVAPIKQQLIAMATAGGNLASLANLWIQAGGPPGVAQIAAAIAMAESGGRNVIQQGQPYGSTGWGLWQITPGNSEPQFGIDQALLIPINNAHAAVAKYQAAGGFGPWTTYTSGAYKQFLGGGGGGGDVSATGLVPQVLAALAFARRNGWTGRVTSGFRTRAEQAALYARYLAGGPLAAAPGTSSHEKGQAVDVTDTAGFAHAMALDPARLYARVAGEPWHYSVTGYRKGGIRGFAGGGINWGKFMPHKGHKGHGRAGHGGGGLPSAASIIGLPSLPIITDPFPMTAADIRGVAAKIHGNRSAIAGLEQSFGVIDQYFTNTDGALSYTDPNTGLRNEQAIKQRIDHLNILIEYRQKIFALWSWVVAFTQRLIEANERMVRVLNAVLMSLSTKGLKGKALTAMQNRIKDTKTQIKQYRTNTGTARTDLQGAIGDRQTAWLNLQSLLGEKWTTAGTAIDTAITGAAGAAAATAAADPSAQLLQQLLQQANLRTAVSQAQYATLPPFGGSFAAGGIIPGPVGAPRVIIAHGGESVTPAGTEVHVHIAPGMDWLRQFINVEVNQATRTDSRLATRALPGSR